MFIRKEIPPAGWTMFLASWMYHGFTPAALVPVFGEHAIKSTCRMLESNFFILASPSCMVLDNLTNALFFNECNPAGGYFVVMVMESVEMQWLINLNHTQHIPIFINMTFIHSNMHTSKNKQTYWYKNIWI